MASRGWSVLFAGVLLACLGLCAAAPYAGWWLPPVQTREGAGIDRLFTIILAITGLVFLLTEALLVVAMYRFAARPGRRAVYLHGNLKLELTWTVIPAFALLYITWVQVPEWARIKYGDHFPPPDHLIQVTGRQWEWRMRHPSEGLVPANEERAWADLPRPDDVHAANEVHTWKGANVKLYLKAGDVIHSFNLPHFRLKQDMLPGRTIAMWFAPLEANARFDADKGEVQMTGPEWEVSCTEHCGSGHYRMRGRVVVFETPEEFLAWRDHRREEQTRTR